MKWFLKTFVASMVLSSTVAIAGFSVVKPAPTSTVSSAGAPTSSAGLAAVRYIGVPIDSVETRSGFGRGVNASDALKQIAPVGWHAQLKDSMVKRFDGNRKVSWKGGKPWVNILDDVLSEQGLSADVDWNTKTLFVGDHSDFVASRTLAIGEPAVPMKPAPPVIPTWRAAQGTTLRDAIESWAKTASWTVRWEAEGINYPIAASLQYQGTYVSAASSAISAFAHAEKPLWICLYTRQQLTRVTPVPCDRTASEAQQ